MSRDGRLYTLICMAYDIWHLWLMVLGFVAPHFPTDCSIKMTLYPTILTVVIPVPCSSFLQPFPGTQSWEHAPCTPPPPLMQAAPLGDFTCMWRYLEPVLPSIMQRSFHETASCFLSESDGWTSGWACAISVSLLAFSEVEDTTWVFLNLDFNA